MPRKTKPTPTFRYTFDFEDGTSTKGPTVGEAFFKTIEQVVKMAEIARSLNDHAGMVAAQQARQRIIKEIDFLAGKHGNKQAKGSEGGSTEKQQPKKKDLAKKEIERLRDKEKKADKNIPGILVKKGICSARYARDILKEMRS
jgi:hypothetical protein